MNGDFPTTWCEALFISFHKPNKSGNLPQDYWHIALTSCLCKLLDNIVDFHLMWHLELRILSQLHSLKADKLEVLLIH